MAKTWDIDMIGILATDDYVRSKKGENSSSVFINNHNMIQYHIRLISEPPESFPKIELFSGYISDIQKFNFEEQINLDYDSRIDNFEKAINEYFFVFNPVQKGDHYNLDNVRLKKINPAYDWKETFVPIPLFIKKSDEYDVNSFIEKIKKKQYLGRIDKFSTEPDDTPKVIFWSDEKLSEIFILGLFEKHRYAYGGFQFECSSIKCIKFKEEWYDHCFNNDSKQIFFIENEIFRNIISEMGKSDPIEKNEEVVAQYGKPLEQRFIPATEEEIETDNEYTDVKLLNKFIQITRDNNFLYDEKDLINFHTSMKTSNLVILSGMSGTGKSKLVDFYRKALNMDDTQFKLIPVRPSWSDDSDLLGYVDSMHMVYKAGDSGLVDTLVRASRMENSDKLYIICFDEMNLARVEHYFSQFLSVLEMEPGKRILRLYSEEIKERLYNNNIYPSEIKIGENIMFVGTVNVDESTYHFSDKVLDRANIINLRVKYDFKRLKELSVNNKNNTGIKPTEEKYEWTYKDFRNIKDSDTQIKLSERELELLLEIHNRLNRVNKNIGVGFRIVVQMDNFLKYLPSDPTMNGTLIERKEAIDLQIVQRVLTKVRGAEDQLKDLLMDPKDGKEDSLWMILDRYSDVSDFHEAKKVLEQKRKELSLYGYTY